MGVSTLGSGLGTVIIAPLISLLLEHYGYQGAMMITGALILNNCVASALYRPVEDNFPKKSKSKPQNLDLQGVNTGAENVTRSQTSNVPNGASKGFGKLKKHFTILKNHTFFLYCIEITAMSIAIQTFLTFLPGLAKEYKAAGDKEAAFLLSIMGIADMGGRLSVGFAMDLKQVSAFISSSSLIAYCNWCMILEFSNNFFYMPAKL